MTDGTSEKRARVEKMRQAAAEEFDRTLDPLADLQDSLDRRDIDPFFMYEVDVLNNKELGDSARKHYDSTFGQWRDYMVDEGRNPACPNEEHVFGFITHLREERGNTDEVVRQKLHALNAAYEYWQDDGGLPHPKDYNPFRTVQAKVTLSRNEKQPFPNLSIEDLREHIGDITHIGYRAIVGTQLKLGLRRGELCNIRLEDVNLQHTEVNDFYDELGTHEMVRDRPNSVYIPPNPNNDRGFEGRAGNKSMNPRVLPLDTEVRALLVRYLTIRPTADEPWLFLAKRSYGQLRDKTVNAAWKEAFYPKYQYGEDARRRSITSHYARHFFSNYWETEAAQRGLPLKYVMYLRGDKQAADDVQSHSIDHYLQAYYEDVCDIYLDGIYRLRLADIY